MEAAPIVLRFALVNGVAVAMVVAALKPSLREFLSKSGGSVGGGRETLPFDDCDCDANEGNNFSTKGKLIQLKMKSRAEDCPRCKKNDSMVPLKVNIN